jgi:hypothetical protein
MILLLKKPLIKEVKSESIFRGSWAWKWISTKYDDICTSALNVLRGNRCLEICGLT